MEKKMNYWLVLMLVFTLLTNGVQTHALAAQQDQGKQGTITIIGTDEANPLLAETPVQFNENETATQSLIKTVGEENIEFTDTAYGKMLTGIKGLKAEGTHFWAFFINGVSAQIGSDSYVVQNGDKLTFRYTDWTKPAQNTVSIKVIDRDSNVLKNLTGVELIGQPNAFQLLQTAVAPDQVGYTDTQYGKMITSINGIKAEGTNYWAFYIDGQMAQVGAESYLLKPGNQISFQLESWEDSPETGGGSGENPTPNPPSGTVSEADLKTSVDTGTDYLLKNSIGEWEAVALKQAGKTIPAGYLESVKELVKERQGKFTRITDTERYVMGILAAGGDPTNIEGYNLIEAIYKGNVTKQGLIGVSYALLALDSANFTVPDSAQWTREKLISYLMEKQNADGGWAWDESTTSDIDTTAMILISLAQYKEQAGVKEKVDLAIQYLKEQYQAGKIDNSSTAAQVVIALSTLEIDANGSQFTKDSSSLFQYLLSFQNKDGGFDFQGGDESDPFSSTQGILGVVAYQLYSQGKGSLYQLPLQEQTPEQEKPDAETPQTEQKPADPPSPTVKTAGNTLPDTATNMYNLLALGLMFILTGSLFYVKQRKRSMQ